MDIHIRKLPGSCDIEQEFYLVSDVERKAEEQIAALTERLSQTVSCVDYKQQTCTLCTALSTENKRLRQIVKDCYVGWPDEVLQKTLRGEEESHESTPQSEQERTEFICSGDDNRNRRSIGKHHRGRK